MQISGASNSSYQYYLEQTKQKAQQAEQSTEDDASDVLSKSNSVTNSGALASTVDSYVPRTTGLQDRDASGSSKSKEEPPAGSRPPAGVRPPSSMSADATSTIYDSDDDDDDDDDDDETRSFAELNGFDEKTRASTLSPSSGMVNSQEQVSSTSEDSTSVHMQRMIKGAYGI